MGTDGLMDVVPSHNYNFYSEEAKGGRGFGLGGGDWDGYRWLRASSLNLKT